MNQILGRDRQTSVYEFALALELEIEEVNISHFQNDYDTILAVK
jgi:hypothetical protein